MQEEEEGGTRKRLREVDRRPEQPAESLGSDDEQEDREEKMNEETKKKSRSDEGGGGDQDSEKDNPLLQLKFSNPQYFQLTKGRVPCPKCKSQRKFFCYDCHLLLGEHKDLVPQLTLPVDCDILHHPTESKSKSTSLHAAMLSPKHVRMYEFPDEIPDYRLSKEGAPTSGSSPSEAEAEEGVYLLFPSKDAKSVDEIDIGKMKKLVVIDSTWQRAKAILRDERVRCLPCVKINSHKTLFWRYQTVGDTCLATIEAIYYFYREYAEKMLRLQQAAERGEGTSSNGSSASTSAASASAQKGGETGKGTEEGELYDGRYDDLLFFYAHMYHLIQDTYKAKQKKFKRIDNYIK